MTISIPEQYQSLKTKLETIVKKTIIQYELASSDYNPYVGSTITITCTCKNILGNPVSNKTLTLYEDGEILGTATTNSNGVATWTATIEDYKLHTFSLGENNIQVKALAKVKRLVDEYGIIWSVNDETGVNMISYNNTFSINANSYTTVKNAYGSTDEKIKYCPTSTYVAPTNNKGVEIMVTYLGEIRIYNRNSSNISNVSLQAGMCFVGKEYRYEV